MRLRLTLRPAHRDCTVSLNYAYYLSAAIYRWIEASSPEYARLAWFTRDISLLKVVACSMHIRKILTM
jgi:CRISPR/Cas system endoribonuclease Cas6 (RAMP superfamily)